MPANLVETPEDERDWKRAKQRAQEEGEGENWRYVNKIFQQLKQERERQEKKASLMKKVAAQKMRPSARQPVIRQTHSAHEFAVVDE